MRKHSMVRLSGAVVLAVLLGSLGQLGASSASPRLVLGQLGASSASPRLVLMAVSPCADACYRQKSTAYQRCRTIPPTDRASRTGCFKTADRSLEVCLRACR